MDKKFEEMLKKISNPNIKDFKMDKKRSLFINPSIPEVKKSTGDLYVYSITIGHLWIIELIKEKGYGQFLKDLILFAKENMTNLLEWTISKEEEKGINNLLSKYDLEFKRKIVQGINVWNYEEELNLLKEKNHPYHALVRILLMSKSNSLPQDFLDLNNLEEELTEKSPLINSMYIALKMAGIVEKEEEITPNEEIMSILREYSPCMVENKEMKYYPKPGIENNYFLELPEMFSRNWDWLDDESAVIISKLLYSFRIINELTISLFAVNGILASTATRILFDNYWQTKYLIEKNEIQQYMEFALDRMRLHILKRTGKEDIEDIGILMMASRSGLLEPIPIHGDYFKNSVREYAIQLNLKEEYDKYYEYNSEFIHASLTAVLSGIMVECTNPEHINHLTVHPTSTRYINVIPHIFEIINAHINLVNQYLGVNILENVKMEDYFFTERKSFLVHMETLYDKKK